MSLSNRSVAWALAAILGSTAAVAALPYDLRLQSAQSVAGATRLAPEGSTYVLVSAGLHEDGRALPGDPAPADDTLANALRDALHGQGLLPASSTEAPTLLIVYHGGALRDEVGVSGGVASGQSAWVQTPDNLLARLRVLGPETVAGGPELAAALAQRDVTRISSDARSLLRRLEEERYFFTVSAYAYASVDPSDPQPLWRATASTTRGRMADALVGAANVVSEQLTANVGARASSTPASRLSRPDVSSARLPAASVERIVAREVEATMGSRLHSPVRGYARLAFD